MLVAQQNGKRKTLLVAHQLLILQSEPLTGQLISRACFEFLHYAKGIAPQSLGLKSALDVDLANESMFTLLHAPPLLESMGYLKVSCGTFLPQVSLESLPRQDTIASHGRIHKPPYRTST
jgi:hypothetical protein